MSSLQHQRNNHEGKFYDIEFFMVGGGGGASGYSYLGGGGAGGFILSKISKAVKDVTYQIVIGAGGNGNGSPTTFNGLTALGGGGSGVGHAAYTVGPIAVSSSGSASIDAEVNTLTLVGKGNAGIYVPSTPGQPYIADISEKYWNKSPSVWVGNVGISYEEAAGGPLVPPPVPTASGDVYIYREYFLAAGGPYAAYGKWAVFESTWTGVVNNIPGQPYVAPTNSYYITGEATTATINGNTYTFPGGLETPASETTFNILLPNVIKTLTWNVTTEGSLNFTTSAPDLSVAPVIVGPVSVTGTNSVNILPAVNSITLVGKGSNGSDDRWYNPGQPYVAPSGFAPPPTGWAYAGSPSYVGYGNQGQYPSLPSVPSYSSPLGTVVASYYQNGTTEIDPGNGQTVYSVYAQSFVSVNQGEGTYTNPGQPYIAPSSGGSLITGSSTTATINGNTYTFPGGVGTAAVSTTHTVTLPVGDKTLSWSISSGGNLNYTTSEISSASLGTVTGPTSVIGNNSVTIAADVTSIILVGKGNVGTYVPEVVAVPYKPAVYGDNSWYDPGQPYIAEIPAEGYWSDTGIHQDYLLGVMDYSNSVPPVTPGGYFTHWVCNINTDPEVIAPYICRNRDYSAVITKAGVPGQAYIAPSSGGGVYLISAAVAGVAGVPAYYISGSNTTATIDGNTYILPGGGASVSEVTHTITLPKGVIKTLTWSVSSSGALNYTTIVPGEDQIASGAGGRGDLANKNGTAGTFGQGTNGGVGGDSLTNYPGQPYVAPVLAVAEVPGYYEYQWYTPGPYEIGLAPDDSVISDQEQWSPSYPATAANKGTKVSITSIREWLYIPTQEFRKTYVVCDFTSTEIWHFPIPSVPGSPGQPYVAPSVSGSVFGGGGGGYKTSGYSINAGEGVLCEFLGLNKFYASGGGGVIGDGAGGVSKFGKVYPGGGGLGGYSNPSSGSANTGGGGGGYVVPGSSYGGSGIVVLRYKGAQRGVGGVVSSYNGYTLHTFTTSGTYKS